VESLFVTDMEPGPIRSLIALSLMMAILQTRPSPLYIFDEIDSAMDMSHTSKM
jgi:structural maintenance of chromosome 2